MIEVELKAKIQEPEKIRKQMKDFGFSMKKTVKESDWYYNGVDRNFRKTDEALRIRETEDLITGEMTAVLTYKGPKMDEVSMTRVELETKIENAETGKAILRALGYQQIFPVIKRREYYQKEKMTICLDEVEGLGDFMEIEMIVSEESQKQKAWNQMEQMLERLGYTLQDTTRTSYLSMLISG